MWHAITWSSMCVYLKGNNVDKCIGQCHQHVICKLFVYYAQTVFLSDLPLLYRISCFTNDYLRWYLYASARVRVICYIMTAIALLHADKYAYDMTFPFNVLFYCLKITSIHSIDPIWIAMTGALFLTRYQFWALML